MKSSERNIQEHLQRTQSSHFYSWALFSVIMDAVAKNDSEILRVYNDEL